MQFSSILIFCCFNTFHKNPFSVSEASNTINPEYFVPSLFYQYSTNPKNHWQYINDQERTTRGNTSCVAYTPTDTGYIRLQTALSPAPSFSCDMASRFPMTLAKAYSKITSTQITCSTPSLANDYSFCDITVGSGNDLTVDVLNNNVLSQTIRPIGIFILKLNIFYFIHMRLYYFFSHLQIP